MKRRILGTAAVLLSSLALFACGGKNEEAKPAETTKAEGTEAQKADAEKTEASSTDSGSDNDGKKQCQGEHNHSAKKPDAKQIPHRNAEQRRI